MGLLQNDILLRPLSQAEAAMVSGGTEDEPTTLGTVTVVGQIGAGGGFSISLGGAWGGGGSGEEQHDSMDPIGDDTSYDDPDDNEVEITVNINRPLTDSEKQALQKLAEAISATSKAINAIPDNAEVTLSNGAKVTGAELKEIWGKTDFTINETGTGYSNTTTRGAANYNNGDPQVSLNINIVEGYAAHGAAGANYLVMHELGHMTAAGRAANQQYAGAAEGSAEWIANERIANDIARAITNYGGLGILGSPGGGYSDTVANFVVPQPQPNSGGGGGGGGGGGYGGDPYDDDYNRWYHTP